MKGRLTMTGRSWVEPVYCYHRLQYLQYNEEMRDEKGRLFYSRVSFGSSTRRPAFTGRLKYATHDSW